MSDKNKIFCVISHTHWDREWYMPLENFRHRLTDLMDHLLDILDKNPSYIFHLDAQTVVLEDYLLVRPEKRQLLVTLISDRRIIIGPWYLQNDFYLTSGEATVRNLLEGARLMREFGGRSRAGYAADQFGNPDQLPQILKDFGYNNFVFGRGFAKWGQEEDGKPRQLPSPTEFIWKGADGTEVLAIHMRHWYNNAQRFSADIDKASRYLASIEASFDNEFTLTPYLLLMNGVDHLEAQGNLLPILSSLADRLPEGQDILQYSLDDYVSDVQQYLAESHIMPEVVTGPLRRSHDVQVLQGTLSSRPYLKISNDEAQILLENKLEPLYSLMELSGLSGATPRERLRYLWKNLLRNHPHDSICGCSHDAVHAHMENRFSEIFEYGEELLRRGLLSFSESTASARNGKEDEYLINVVNTLAFARGGIVTCDVKLATDDGYGLFTLLSPEGKPVPYEILSDRVGDTNVYSPINLPGKVRVRYVTLSFDPGILSGFSLKTFLITHGEPAFISSPAGAESRDVFIENDILSLGWQHNTGFVLTDKVNGRILPQLVSLEDTTDIGNAYTYIPAGLPARKGFVPEKITLLRKSELVQCLRAEYTLKLPEAYDFASRSLSATTADSRLCLDFSLEAGSPVLRLDYTLENASSDHRLRLVFQGDIGSENFITDAPFDVFTHTKDTFCPTGNDFTVPASSFAAVESTTGGWALFTVGGHELEHTADNQLAVTLVRSTGTIDNEGTENWLVPANQCLRKLSGRMGFTLYIGSGAEQLPNRSLDFRVPFLAGFAACDRRKFAGGRPCVQDTSVHEYFYLPDSWPEATISSGTTPLKITGDGITVTAFKKSEDGTGFIVRLLNPTCTERTVSLSGNLRFWQTTCSEESRHYLGRNEVVFPMGAKKITTVYCVMP